MKKLFSFAGAALLALTIGVVGCDDDTAVTPVAPPPPPAPIFGTVSGMVSVEGSGLAGVNVNLSGAASQSASTGSSGGYSFDNVPAGTHSVQISGAPDEVTFGSIATAVTITTSGQTATADFSGNYIRTSIIEGSVTAGGEGVVATVTASGAGRLMSEQANSGSSDVDGDFELTGLRAGTYHVEISQFPEGIEFLVTMRDVTVDVGLSANVSFDAPGEDGPTTGTGASLIITGITDEDVTDDKISGRVTVTIDVERGEFEKIALYVDGAEVDAEIFGFGPAPAEEPPLAAQQGVEFDLSFNSAEYDPDTGEVSYPNGPHYIVAGVTVQGSTKEALSNRKEVEFKNSSVVLASVNGLGEGAMNSKTGQVWYGGPDVSVEISALAVSYSSGAAVSSVTLLPFCGDDAATDSEAPFSFPVDCDGFQSESDGTTPSFNVGGAEIDSKGGKVYYLDFKAPDAPHFNANPNGREAGWVNPAVDFLGEYDSSKNKDGWLVYNEDEEGVGGYAPQLRFSSTTPSIVDGALEATANALPTAPTKTNAVCVIATAVDLLDNESKLPSAGKACVPDAVYEGFVGVLEMAEGDEAIADAQEKIPAGIRAGLDVTAPTAEFTAAAPKASPPARKLKEFQVRVVDETDGSGLPALPLLASISIRTADNKMSCGKDDDDLPGNNSLTGECKSDTDGYRFIGALGTTTGLLPPGADTKTGYYTFSAYARDRAGNKSTGISRVALHDPTAPDVGIIAGSWDEKTSEYSVTVTLTDDFSIRDYYVALDFPEATYLPLPDGIFRVKAVEGIDGYDSELSQSEILTKDVGAFRALQQASPAGGDTDMSGAAGAVSADDPLNLTEVVVKARAQDGGYSSATGTVAVTALVAVDGFQGKTSRAVVDATDLDDATTMDIVEGNHILSFTAKADANTAGDMDDNDYDQDDMIKLRAMVVGHERDPEAQIGTPADGVTAASEDYMAAVPADLFANPFSRVDFYAEAYGAGDLRLVASIPASSGYPVSVALENDQIRTTADSEVTWIYEMEVSAADFHDAVGAGRNNYGIPGTRMQLVAVGVHERGNGVALVSPMVSISIED